MFAADVGGTFTDVVALRDGEPTLLKVPTDQNRGHRSVLEGVRKLGIGGAGVFNHASTHGLNAVITRRLPKVAFLTTEGHRDILDQGSGFRPVTALLDPHWRRSFGDAADPLVPRYLRRGVRERITADGGVLIALDEGQAREQLGVLRRCGVEGVAICLINGYLNPAHEQRLRQLVAEELGEVACSVSHEVSRLAGEYARSSTTVLDTFMKLVYGDYTDEIQKGLVECGFTGRFNFADCAAQLIPVERAMNQPFRIVFAGPAAGAVSCAHFGATIGEPNIVCADVGGTSCDISVVADGQTVVDTRIELEHDLIVNALAIDVSSIGAGGGSVITVGTSGEILVGPGSAGAQPGPACYGRGGTAPTTTDACLLIGILDADSFAGGRHRLDPRAALTAFEDLDCNFTVPERISFAHRMAINNLAEGVFNVAVRRGIDPRDYTLMAYGAAGPMLLPAVLDVLRCKQVVVPPNPGLFSALGLLSSDQVVTADRSSYTILTPEAAPAIEAMFADLEAGLRAHIDAGRRVMLTRSFDGRLRGQAWETPFTPVPDGVIDGAAVATMISSFHDTYQARSGNRFEHMPVEAVTFRVSAVFDTPKVCYRKLARRVAGAAVPVGTTELRYLGEADRTTAVYERTTLLAGDEIQGPAIIREPNSTTHIRAGQRVRVGDCGELVIRAVNTDATNNDSPP
jgi:N-methylhydantoinase A